MIHMLCSLDLKPPEGFARMPRDCHAVFATLMAADVNKGSGSLKPRLKDTLLDKDVIRPQSRFVRVRFQDRYQSDICIDTRKLPGAASHPGMCRRFTNTGFPCWEDNPPREDTA